MSRFCGKTVLLTGGTGSFGRMFIRLALQELPIRKIVVFSRDELKQFEMAQRMRDERVEFVIGDVRDRDRLFQAMEGVDLVVHAAALKQVPAGEKNPSEPVKTNILGAMNIIEAARECGVEQVIALSTDKAVQPVNLYGATKLIAEKLFIAANPPADQDGTRMAIVRYGNVVGSRGSVVPALLRQRSTGVVFVTDPRMTRFWITLQQGVRFVFRALEAMRGGEVFVPKLPTARITDLVAAIAPNCRQEVIGIRPGEKVHEMLISVDEARRTLEYDDAYVIRPDVPDWSGNGWGKGRPVPPDFAYTSDTNPWTLSVSEIQAMLEGLDDEAQASL